MDVTFSESFDGVTWLRLMYVDSLKVAKMVSTKSIATGTVSNIRYSGAFENWCLGARYFRMTFKPHAPVGYKAKIEGKIWFKSK